MVTAYFTVAAQHDFGFKANGGLSCLSVKTETTQTQVPKFYFVPSGQGGLFYRFNFKDKFSFSTEFLFVQIEGKETLKLPLTDQNGNLTGNYSDGTIYRHISYLGIPLYLGYTFKKVNINFGLQANFTLSSSAESKGQVNYNGQLYTWDNKSDKLYINSTDYGIFIGLVFKLTDKFSIESNYYYGLTNLIKDSQLANDWTWKVQQVTMGLRYKLFSLKPNSESVQNPRKG
jgi:opacity protein-like surface antigen